MIAYAEFSLFRGVVMPLVYAIERYNTNATSGIYYLAPRSNIQIERSIFSLSHCDGSTWRVFLPYLVLDIVAARGVPFAPKAG